MDWVDKVCKWPIRRIIPCHFANNIKATSNDFRKAFTFLEEQNSSTSSSSSSLFGGFNVFKKKDNTKSRPPCPIGDPRDIKLLADISIQLTESGVLYPEAPLLPKRK